MVEGNSASMRSSDVSTFSSDIEPVVEPASSHLWVWILLLICFYAVWLSVVTGLGYWSEVTAHWPIALAMAIGSYASGSTPMGGGSVGFPILALLFDESVTVGRDFSFAIQSIGMVSASIFILARRQVLAWSMLKGAALGTLVGLPVGLLWVAPSVPEIWAKVSFATILCSFGILHLYRFREIAEREGFDSRHDVRDYLLGVATGFVACATVVSATGVGVDMAIYMILTLLVRADLKVAIPTSVVIMGFASLVGLGFTYITGGIDHGVFGHWTAAAPVVAIGAPLGVYVVSLIGRKPTLLVVALLCLAQFVWTLSAEWPQLGLTGCLIAILSVAAVLWAIEWLYHQGKMVR